MSAHELDARGRLCPLPIVLLSRELRHLAAGEIVSVMADDGAFPAAVRAWCEETGNELIAIDHREDVYTARVKKSA